MNRKRVGRCASQLQQRARGRLPLFDDHVVVGRSRLGADGYRAGRRHVFPHPHYRAGRRRVGRQVHTTGRFPTPTEAAAVATTSGTSNAAPSCGRTPASAIPWVAVQNPWSGPYGGPDRIEWGTLSVPSGAPCGARKLLEAPLIARGRDRISTDANIP